MAYKLKKCLNLIIMIFSVFLSINNTQAISVVGRCARGYRLFDYPYITGSTCYSALPSSIQAVFNVKFKNPANKIVYENTAFLCFIPSISDDEQIIRLINIAFPVFYDRERFSLISVMRLTESFRFLSVISVHVGVPF